MTIRKSFLDYCEGLDDQRVLGLVTYPLSEILLCSLCAIICRRSDWEEVNQWGKYHLKWLRKFLPFESGIPKANTFARVFNSLGTKKFKTCFEEWISSLSLDVAGKLF